MAKLPNHIRRIIGAPMLPPAPKVWPNHIRRIVNAPPVKDDDAHG